ncbi:RNA helicase Mov10l1 [Chionoecetes opilio]|uniref:RNA helicase n=1 Tax=Chionoecetes opilio TaxID=41210 RepID=A0A8J8WNE2_CHIOP|nr:RNA helicase Mov10l1 [Chionoecetes opilio]
MITLIQKAVRYAVGSSKSDVLQETLSFRPKLEDFVSTSHSAPETKEFEGLVTSIDSSCIVIDQDVYCEPSEFPPNKVCLGVKVRGLAQRGGNHEMWRAKTIELVHEGWDTGPHCSGNKNIDRKKGSASVAASDCEAVSCRDLAEGIPGIFKSDLLSSVSPRSDQTGCVPECSQVSARPGGSKTVIGKVTGVYGDTVTLNDSICFKSTHSSCSMDVVTGDWIVCEVDGSSPVDGEECQLQGPLQVSSFKPLRKKKVRGEVTHSYETHFIVNEEIFCSRSIAGAILARTGDAMTAEVIESQQGRLCWRAISVASDYPAPSMQEPGAPLSLVQLGRLPKVDVGKNSRSQKISEDEGDIRITQAIRFPQVMFGSASFMDVSVKNSGQRPRTLQKVYFVYASQESQFSVTWCSAGGVVDGTARTLEAGAEVVVRLCCAGTLIGLFRQLCIFEFKDFHIGRHVSATVEDSLMASLAPVSSYMHRPRHHALTTPPDERAVILGQKSYKPSPFIPLKLPSVRVPENLWHEVNRGDLFHVAAVLSEPLNADNYQKRFSLLLHLEEIKMTQQMREFDMARACFTMCGEFLSLTVPGLAEKRPSLMIGDTVVATELCGRGEMEYEGCIHQVLNTQILLKFHPSFHNGNHGEDYKVRFNFNRTPLRRCHFALSYALKQLGQDVLFPFRLKLQLPQVCYVDPEIQELTKRWKHCSSISHQLLHAVKDTNKPSADAPVSEWQPSPSKLPVVTRLFGMPLQESNASRGCRKSEISPDDNVSIKESFGNEALAVDITKESCLSNREKYYLFQTKRRMHSQKQESCHASFTSRCSASSPKDQSVSQGSGLDSTDKVTCLRKEIHEKKEAEASLGQHKSISLQEISNKQELGDPLHEWKVNKADTGSSALTPPSQDLAISRTTIRTKVASTREEILEKEEILRDQKTVMKESVGDSRYENHRLENGKTDRSDGNSCHLAKEKYIPGEVCRRENNTSSNDKPRKKVECDAAHRTMDNKAGYVIPVLPFCHSRKKTQNLEKLPILKWFNKSLNREQKLAVRRILEGTTRPLPYIIFGPPGTGKTVTLVEAALQILTLIHHSRLLLVTPSNSASDLVAQRMVESGRLGTSDLVRLIAFQRSKESIPEALQPYCCNGEELEVRAHQRVMVATATCAGVLYMQGLHKDHFTHVLVDEAGQLTEPECLVALNLVNRSTGQIVMAGDPKQLGPVIQSDLAKRGGLLQSLLQRLCQTVLYQAQERSESSTWEYEPSLVTQLVRNYRSHPHILAVPSRLFYNNTLQACADVKGQEHLLSWKELPCSSCPLLFHGVVGTNLREGDSPSWFNPAEAFQVGQRRMLSTVLASLNAAKDSTLQSQEPKDYWWWWAILFCSVPAHLISPRTHTRPPAACCPTPAAQLAACHRRCLPWHRVRLIPPAPAHLSWVYLSVPHAHAHQRCLHCSVDRARTLEQTGGSMGWPRLMMGVILLLNSHGIHAQGETVKHAQ